MISVADDIVRCSLRSSILVVRLSSLSVARTDKKMDDHLQASEILLLTQLTWSSSHFRGVGLRLKVCMGTALPLGQYRAFLVALYILTLQCSLAVLGLGKSRMPTWFSMVLPCLFS